MARIRTVKPEFFRHEGLQDLERLNPGKYPMFVFEGLWTVCDNQGVFEYKPRTLKCDILPFLDFDMAESLSILEAGGFLSRYSVSGKDYGCIPSLCDHQRFSGKEAGEEGKRYPSPPALKPVGSDRETPKQNGEAAENNPEIEGKQEGNSGEAVENNQSFPNAQERELEKEGEEERCMQDAHTSATAQIFGIDPCTPRYLAVKLPNLDPRQLFDTWKTIPGNPDPGDIIRFLNLHARRILTAAQGLAPEDVYKALENYREARASPGTWWNTSPSIATWFEKHLERFLPGNYRAEEYGTPPANDTWSQIVQEEMSKLEVANG